MLHLLTAESTTIVASLAVVLLILPEIALSPKEMFRGRVPIRTIRARGRGR